mmetsp:Transcript_19761/g.50186  ORF Transcript_19761/g.50186 Transcript_19761/m.50186 type:complete len:235 (+) Transcript_19761:1064-1768(+)
MCAHLVQALGVLGALLHLSDGLQYGVALFLRRQLGVLYNRVKVALQLFVLLDALLVILQCHVLHALCAQVGRLLRGLPHLAGALHKLLIVLLRVVVRHLRCRLPFCQLGLQVFVVLLNGACCSSLQPREAGAHIFEIVQRHAVQLRFLFFGREGGVVVHLADAGAVVLVPLLHGAVALCGRLAQLVDLLACLLASRLCARSESFVLGKGVVVPLFSRLQQVFRLGHRPLARLLE